MSKLSFLDNEEFPWFSFFCLRTSCCKLVGCVESLPTIVFEVQYIVMLSK